MTYRSPTSIIRRILNVLTALVIALAVGLVAATHPRSPFVRPLVKASDANPTLPADSLLSELILRHFNAGVRAMLWLGSADGVADLAGEVHPHYRPWFTAGAGMGFFGAGWVRSGFDADSYDVGWAALRPHLEGEAYLGPGLWYGRVEADSPQRLRGISKRLSSDFFRPRVWEGYGLIQGIDQAGQLKTGWAQVEGLPSDERRLAALGFGRALALVGGDGALEAYTTSADEVDTYYLNAGYAFSLAYDQIHHISQWISSVHQAPGEELRRARLMGGTMALMWRARWDERYTARCLSDIPQRQGWTLRTLIQQCGETSLDGAADYLAWAEAASQCALVVWELGQGEPGEPAPQAGLGGPPAEEGDAP